MRLSRRRLLGMSAGALTVPPLLSACDQILPSGGAVSEAESSAGTMLRSEIELPDPFTVQLPVPPVLEPIRRDADTDYFAITQKHSALEILPGRKTEVWGYDGIFPGPTIVSRRGRRTEVEHRNELPVPTVVHLHGGHTPAEHDGYPTDLISGYSGGGGGDHGHHEPKTGVGDNSRNYVYPMDQPAATLWYHDHRMDYTGPQVYRGLAGFHLVHDDEEDRLPLPRGERDIPLMIADRAFGEDGSFRYPSRDRTLTKTPGVSGDYMSGVLGDCVLVNGHPWPLLEVENVRYRFRVLNASNARRYRLALDPPPPSGSAFVQIGSDQGLLAAPVEHDELEIAQAERFDVLVDFSAYSIGQEVTVVNTLGKGSTRDVMRFVVARRGREDSAVPKKLVEIEPLSRAQASVERELTFSRGGEAVHGVTPWRINGEVFDPDTISARPRLGSVELWKIRSQNVPHPIHVHLAPFQVLTADQNRSERGPYNAGWKDTVNLGNGDQAEILLRFQSDPVYRGTYVFHCHNLEHEDMMMMGNFRLG